MGALNGSHSLAVRWLWLLLVGLVAGAVSGYFVSARLPEVYQARAVLLVTPGQGETGADYNSVLVGVQLARTYPDLIMSRSLMESALRAGGISMDYEEAVKLLTVEPIRNTQLIQIIARGNNQQVVSALPNLLANAIAQQTATGRSQQGSATRDSLSRQLDDLGATLTRRTRQLDSFLAQPADTARDAEIALVQSQIRQIQQTYAATRQSYQDVLLSQVFNGDLLSVVEPSSAAMLVGPQTFLSVIAGAVAGLVATLLAAFALDHSDDRLGSGERLTLTTGLKAIGILPELGGQSRRIVHLLAAGARVPADADGLSQSLTTLVEAVRLLHANLQFAGVDQPIDSLLVTSSEMGEGKSTVAATLAVVAAQAGRKVVLVDADLRRPSQHHLFAVPNEVGLTSLLVDDRLAVHEALMGSTVSNLAVLTTGPQPANPGEFAASARMRARLSALKSEADLLVVDAAPALAVSDAAVLAPQLDGVLLVTDARRTSGRRAARTVAIIERAGGRIIGAVLNRAPTTAGPSFNEYVEPTKAQPHSEWAH